MGLSCCPRFATHRHTPPWKELGWAKVHHTLFSWWWNVLHSRLGCANPLSPPVPTQSSLTSSSWRTRSGVGAWGGGGEESASALCPAPPLRGWSHCSYPTGRVSCAVSMAGTGDFLVKGVRGISPSKYVHKIQVWSCYTLRSGQEKIHIL